MRHGMMWAAVCALALATGASARGADKEKAEVGPVLNHTMTSLSGKQVDLSKYQGKVLLIVNTASQCGATPQYEGLQNLHEKYKDEGLAVLGFPCNQFGAQEPGTEKEIAEFCKENYGVSFDMFSKVDVNGKNACDLFEYLTSKEAHPADPGPVKWNFEKFLVGRDGKVVARFRTGVEPDSEDVVQAIEAELEKK